MVKANELRIGNWIADHEAGGYFQIEEIYKDSYGTYSASYRNSSIRCIIEELEPIRITEEWLVKFGAEVYEFDNGQANQYRIKEDLFVIRDGIICHYGTSVKLEYVHALQNLYFALRGQELETKGGNNE